MTYGLLLLVRNHVILYNIRRYLNSYEYLDLLIATFNPLQEAWIFCERTRIYTCPPPTSTRRSTVPRRRGFSENSKVPSVCRRCFSRSTILLSTRKVCSYFNLITKVKKPSVRLISTASSSVGTTSSSRR